MNDQPKLHTSDVRVKQKRLPLVGTIYDVFIMTSPLMSPVSYLMLSSTAYAVTREYLLAVLPWLNYGIFLSFLVGFYLLSMLFVYKFMYASYFSHRNDQEYRHNNPIRRDIAVNAERLDRIETLLNELSGRKQNEPDN